MGYALSAPDFQPVTPPTSVKDGKLIPSTVTFDNYRGIFRGD